MSEISATHKHVRIGNRVYSTNRRKGDSRYWDCGQSWGPTPEKAAREEHKYFKSGTKTVAELHERETY